MRLIAVAFVAGIVFAVGLGLSGMTDPNKVVGFLDVASAWDPSLGFVMAGAIAVHVGAAQWALRARKPLWSGTFAPLGPSGVDTPLVVGATLFGLGWGISGFCPGPALVDLVAPSTSLLVFVASMIAGMGAFRAGIQVWPRIRPSRSSQHARTRSAWTRTRTLALRTITTGTQHER
jgi:uncharacterized membrane protein YedE/YeeE